MRREIELSRRALDDLEDLDNQLRERVILALHRFAETGRGDLSKLRGRDNEWRLRVGDWRVRLELDSEGNTVYVIRVQHRREVYR